MPVGSRNLPTSQPADFSTQDIENPAIFLKSGDAQKRFSQRSAGKIAGNFLNNRRRNNNNINNLGSNLVAFSQVLSNRQQQPSLGTKRTS